jgi:hypothetical protein
VHRFRSYGVELGRRLRAFHERHAVTQAEVAAAVGAGSKTTVTQWETGARTPEGVYRERVEALVAGRLWPDLRASVLAHPSSGTDGNMPARWAAAVRWYRRASRERTVRTALGPAIAAGLDALRTLEGPAALRARYLTVAGAWGSGLARDVIPAATDAADLRRAEDAAFGLRWLEVAGRLRLDLRRHLVPQLPLSLIDRVAGGSATPEPG